MPDKAVTQERDGGKKDEKIMHTPMRGKTMTKKRNRSKENEEIMAPSKRGTAVKKRAHGKENEESIVRDEWQISKLMHARSLPGYVIMNIQDLPQSAQIHSGAPSVKKKKIVYAPMEVDEEEDREVECCVIECNVVGVQYYTGLCDKGEHLLLVREPNNPHDKWAVKACNMNGVQIGHLPRALVAHLAPLMDEMVETLRLAPCTNRPPGTYVMPIKITVYCPMSRLRTIQGKLALALNAYGVKDIRMGDGSGSTTSLRRSALGSMDSSEMFTPLVPWEYQQYVPQPKHITTSMYLHQRIALLWMQRMEMFRHVKQVYKDMDQIFLRNVTDKDMRPVIQGWQERHGIFYNISSNQPTRESPLLLRGGILGDDMGLGKTLEIISLIVWSIDKQREDQREGVTGPTLVVAPLSVLSNWSNQITQHVSQSTNLRVLVHHGATRAKAYTSDKNRKVLAETDVVITSYETLASDFAGGRREEKSTVSSGLYKTEYTGGFFRVILDEAHIIRNLHSQRTKACIAVPASRRWCVTGTVMLNSINDAQALFAFLRLKPWCEDGFWTHKIGAPCRMGIADGFHWVQCLMRTYCLRRHKNMMIPGRDGGSEQPLVDLPSKTIRVQSIDLNEQEMEWYTTVWEQVLDTLSAMAEGRASGKQPTVSPMTAVLVYLTRLRQLCCSMALLPHAMRQSLLRGRNVKLLEDVTQQWLMLERTQGKEFAEKMRDALMKSADEDECVICLELGSTVITPCGHCYHKPCIMESLNVKESCPLCRTPVTQNDLLEKPVDVEDLDRAREEEQAKSSERERRVREEPSSKLLAGLKYVQEHQKRDQIIVFSSFRTFLDLFSDVLHEHEIRHGMIVGSMNLKERERNLQHFQDGTSRVLLISLKAGSLGMNLVTANHVLLMDPWWNVAAEEQAIDRVHRLGQHKDVHVTRFCAAGTIEDRILDVQWIKNRSIRSVYSGRKKSRTDLVKERQALMGALFGDNIVQKVFGQERTRR
eukprot:Clim_evm51s144 gene=Clim_evmTU51s144